MRVAVCDGDERFLLQFKKAIYLFARENKIEIVVDCFVSGVELLRSENNYNLIFLGYYLDDINGFETAVNLRDKGDNTPIIFVSDYTGLQNALSEHFICLGEPEEMMVYLKELKKSKIWKVTN